MTGFDGNNSDYTNSLDDKLDDYSLALKFSNSTNPLEKIKFNNDYISNIKKFLETPYENRITLIAPVRSADEKESKHIDDFIEESKKLGKSVYVPKHYNFQEDETGGIEICNTTRFIIEKSDSVAVLYSPDSEGVKIDFGMSVYWDKKVNLLNPDLTHLLNEDPEKNDPLYEFMMIKSNHMEDIHGFVENGKDLMRLFKQDREAHKPLKIYFDYVKRENNFPALSVETAMQFGIAYASRHPFQISNIDVVKHQLLVEERSHSFKSYSRIAFKLHKLHNPASK